jgi:hypothetical protein
MIQQNQTSQNGFHISKVIFVSVGIGTGGGWMKFFLGKIIFYLIYALLSLNICIYISIQKIKLIEQQQEYGKKTIQ